MTPAELKRAVDAEIESLKAIRRDLHAHPELGYKETRTHGVVVKELTRLGIAHAPARAGGTGVVAHLPATEAGHKGGAVGLRADMDALPIREETGLAYASTTPGVMHACGHDGHTTILLGAARVLQKMRRPRPVTLVFQPAEEGGAGGKRLCEEGLMEGGIIGPRIERMFGLHGWPEAPLGHVWTRPGPLLASTDEIRVTILGTQSHGAYPHYSRDTIVAASHCIVALQSVVGRNISPLEACVVTVGKIEAGTATNIIPHKAEFIGTIRALSAPVRETARRRVREVIEGVAAGLGCEARVEINEGYPVTYNDPALTERFYSLARATLGESHVGVNPHPTMGGEDFSFYAQRAPAVFFCLGLKPAAMERYPTLHQPDFDFNDDAIATGVEMMCACATAE